MRVGHNSENRTLSLRTASAVAQLLDWLPPLRNPEEQYNMKLVHAQCIGMETDLTLFETRGM